MSEEIDAEKMSIGTMLSKSSSGSGNTNSRGGTVNDEEVERALERWRTASRTKLRRFHKSNDQVESVGTEIERGCTG